MSEANKELVRRHFEEIWNRKDLDVADQLMAEDYLEHAEHWATREDLVAMLQLGVVQPPGRPPA
jgi:ketosteroid isomerase-like protein